MTDDPDSSGVDVAIVERDREWRTDLPGCDRLCRAAAIAACRQAETEGLANRGSNGKAGGEVAVVLADDAFVRELNRTYRGKDSATNVLAFAQRDAEPDTALPLGDMPGSPPQLGDVVLARETLLREAADQGKPPADHLRHLVVHGVLHLLGYDHQSDAEASVMEAHEVAALADLGVADPYATQGGHA